jgi:hypothetical protein
MLREGHEDLKGNVKGRMRRNGCEGMDVKGRM